MDKSLLALILLSPFAAAVGTFLAPLRYRGSFLSIVLVLLLLSITGIVVDFEGVTRYEISGWAAPLGINLQIDGLSVVMLLLTCFVAGAVAVYSLGCFSDREVNIGFWPLFFFLWGAINILFVVSDLFTIYVCLEMITFVSVALITTAKKKEALLASLTYLMTALMGSVAFLLGVGMIYAKMGSLDWYLLKGQIPLDFAGAVALSLMTVGLVIKAALFPLHFWLPGAHAVAPPPVSAMLSALVVKTSFYVLLRLWVEVFPDVGMAAHVLGAMGAGAIIWGSFQAIIQDRIKLMVAYSTVAQLGYLFLLFPLLESTKNSSEILSKADVWEGGVYFAISHGIAKAAMFLAAGVILNVTKSDRLKDLAGASSKVPLAILVWGLAGISLIGLPPSGGFIAKWQLLTVAVRFEQWPYVAVILFGGLLASGYVFRVLWYAFIEESEEASLGNVPSTMLFATLFLGVMIVVLGVWTNDVFHLLRIGAPFTGGLPE